MSWFKDSLKNSLEDGGDRDPVRRLGNRLKAWRTHWGCWDLPNRRRSSPTRGSGFWEPGRTVPQPLFLFPRKGPQSRFWLDHSVPSKSWEQVTDPWREHAEVVSSGTRHSSLLEAAPGTLELTASQKRWLVYSRRLSELGRWPP